MASNLCLALLNLAAIKGDRLMKGAVIRKTSAVAIFVVVQLIVVGVPFVIVEAVQPFRDQVVKSVVTMQHFTGAEARAQLNANHLKFPEVAKRRAERMARLRMTAVVDEEHMIALHREELQEIQRVPNGAVGMIVSLFTANAQGTIHQQKNDADAYLTPFDDNGDDYQTKWNHENDTYMHGQYPDEEMEVDTYVNIRIDNSDPDNLPLLETWDEVQPPLARCGSGKEGTFVGLTGLFTLHAQGGYYNGISCVDKVTQAQRKIDRAEHTANVAAAGAAVGCIGSGLGWLPCVGFTWLGSFFADGISWEYGQWSTCGYWPGWSQGKGI
jgi:hypothetical protein